MKDFSNLPEFRCQFIGEAVRYKNNRPKVTLPKRVLDDKLLTEHKKYIFIAVEYNADQTISDQDQ